MIWAPARWMHFWLERRLLVSGINEPSGRCRNRRHPVQGRGPAGVERHVERTVAGRAKGLAGSGHRLAAAIRGSARVPGIRRCRSRRNLEAAEAHRIDGPGAALLAERRMYTKGVQRAGTDRTSIMPACLCRARWQRFVLQVLEQRIKVLPYPPVIRMRPRTQSQGMRHDRHRGSRTVTRSRGGATVPCALHHFRRQHDLERDRDAHPPGWQLVWQRLRRRGAVAHLGVHGEGKPDLSKRLLLRDRPPS